MTTQSHQLILSATPNTRLKMLLEELERQIRVFEEEIKYHERVLRERRQALYAARHLYGIYKPKAKPGLIDVLGVNPERLFGLTLEDAVLLIAEKNEGLVKSTAASRLLREVGILPDDNRARTRLYHHLANSPRYQNIDRGVYRLVEDYEPDSGLTDEQEAMLAKYRQGD